MEIDRNDIIEQRRVCDVRTVNAILARRLGAAGIAEFLHQNFSRRLAP